MRRKIKHPLEEALNIEPESVPEEQQLPVVRDVVEMTQLQPVASPPIPVVYDDRDTTYEGELDSLRTTAEQGYDTFIDLAQTVEQKYRARMGEVAAMFIGHAINAVKEKTNIKGLKDRLAAKVTAPPRTVNNTLIMDRNALLRHMAKRPE